MTGIAVKDDLAGRAGGGRETCGEVLFRIHLILHVVGGIPAGRDLAQRLVWHRKAPHVNRLTHFTLSV